ncbi:unnamed protein product [Lepeophtheirus salmonis]|uniref:(salmon louse) hypothetical protein n=1 Tax=Lepeophtheirus salmonis TaxID=72036 RepID=A0A7R8CZ13_LEPSM|nr:unnamed protein product [Lepeophtheirus salmonis]CAF2946085.1 unnamed protein product [Lepeophtheirus salmonis]
MTSSKKKDQEALRSVNRVSNSEFSNTLHSFTKKVKEVGSVRSVSNKESLNQLPHLKHRTFPLDLAPLVRRERRAFQYPIPNPKASIECPQPRNDMTDSAPFQTERDLLLSKNSILSIGSEPFVPTHSEEESLFKRPRSPDSENTVSSAAEETVSKQNKTEVDNTVKPHIEVTKNVSTPDKKLAELAPFSITE